MRRLSRRYWAGLCALALVSAAGAAETDTQTLYLSGKGKDDPVKWDFMCSAGMNAGKWSTIGVPSNWELQGFGIYTYGTDRKNPWPKVTGNYKRTFTVPDGWAGKEISIVFEGSMTDTQVKVNGESAGPLHAGGYYRFKYDISKLLKAGENTLEVTVDDESATPSVNNAERRGDYWNYAGIYRPVYLEAVPQTSIRHIAIDAQADGTLKADVTVSLGNAGAEFMLKCQLRDAAGNPVGAPFTQPVTGEVTRVSSTLANPKLWNAETPNLYSLDVELDTGARVFHTIHQKFGFRTFEVRNGADGQGLFLNGGRIMLKGVDRHCYWPDSGRCVSEQVSRDDIALIKEMNMNTVRCSHYPPDQHFLDACDELGIYILDELAGWHQAYDTQTGIRLVREMVTRDVNHPSILFWDNGNEGGWNNALDTEFAKYDPQNRHVLHPQQTLRGIDNSHYPQYNAVVTKASGPNVFFPTEMIHGLYDGGHGAGLEDYWNVMLAGKAAAGGILWSLNDEDIVRTDKGGKLDSNGNQAPDGITGPYREKEGSFYTVKQIWSPIVLSAPKEPGSTLTLENRYAFTDAKACTYTWEWRLFKNPKEPGAGYDVTLKGNAKVEGDIPPGTTGKLNLEFPQMGKTPPHDALAVTVKDPNGHVLWIWSWDSSIHGFEILILSGNNDNPAATESADTFTATAGDLSLQFNKKTGLLAAASRAGKTFSFLNGPRLLAANPAPAAPGRGATAPAPLPPLPASALTSFTHKTDGTDVLLTAAFDGPMKSITYHLNANGWLTIDYAYSLTGPHEYFGIGFDYPEANVQSMRYLGNGPSTVYQNRLAGATLDVWDKKYNNTIVGDPDDLAPGQRFDYPIFKGFYAGVRWLQLNTTEGPITALVNQDEAQPLYVQVFTPKTPPANIIGQTGVPFPKAGISFLHAIPAIGSKFNGPKSTGPSGQPAVAKGDYKGSISLYFGALGQP